MIGLVRGLGLAAAKPAPVARGALSVAGKGWSSPARRAGAEGASVPARADAGSASLHVRPPRSQFTPNTLRPSCLPYLGGDGSYAALGACECDAAQCISQALPTLIQRLAQSTPYRESPHCLE